MSRLFAFLGLPPCAVTSTTRTVKMLGDRFQASVSNWEELCDGLAAAGVRHASWFASCANRTAVAAAAPVRESAAELLEEAGGGGDGVASLYVVRVVGRTCTCTFWRPSLEKAQTPRFSCAAWKSSSLARVSGLTTRVGGAPRAAPRRAAAVGCVRAARGGGVRVHCALAARARRVTVGRVAIVGSPSRRRRRRAEGGRARATLSSKLGKVTSAQHRQATATASAAAPRRHRAPSARAPTPRPQRRKPLLGAPPQRFLASCAQRSPRSTGRRPAPTSCAVGRQHHRQDGGVQFPAARRDGDAALRRPPHREPREEPALVKAQLGAVKATTYNARRRTSSTSTGCGRSATA